MEQSTKMGVIGGVVGTALFTYFFQPLLRVLSGPLIRLSGSIFSAFRDGVYRDAAATATDFPAVVVLAYLFVGMAGFVLGFTTAFAFRGSQKSEGWVGRFSRMHPHRATVIGALLGGVLALALLVGAMRPYYVAGLSATFEQHLKTIAPFTPEHDMLLFRSRWARMTTYGDYRAIYVDLSHIATANSVQLPRNNVYMMGAP
jgi:hypothetical protein